MIIGAGAVGVEFASMFKRFGSEVSIFEMLPRLVPVEDEEVSKELERVFKKSKIRVETGAKCEQHSEDRHGVKMKVTLANGKSGRSGSREAAGRRRPRARTPRTSVSKTPRSKSIAASSRSTSSSRPPNRAFTPSATWLPERRSSRTSPPRRAWSRSPPWPASRPLPSTATAFPAPLTPSPASAASA